MIIRLSCPGCRKQLALTVSAAGQERRCPVCNAVFKVPAANPAVPACVRLPTPSLTAIAQPISCPAFGEDRSATGLRRVQRPGFAVVAAVALAVAGFLAHPSMSSNGKVPGSEGKEDATLQSGRYRMSLELRRGNDKEGRKKTYLVQLRNEHGKITITDANGIIPLAISASGKLDGAAFTGELNVDWAKPPCQGKLSAKNELSGTFKGRTEGGNGPLEGSFKLVRAGDLGPDFVRFLKGVQAAAVAVCYSPDGKFIATGTNRGTTHVWDAATGTIKQTMRVGNEQVRGLCFSPDSKQLAACSDYAEKSQLSVWDIATGKQVLPFKRHASTKTMRSVAFSPDGKWLASASDDQTIALWDAKEGIESKTLKGHERAVLTVAFSSDGKHLASGSEDRTVKIWDPTTGTTVQTFKGNEREVCCVCFSADGKLLAYATGSTSGLYDPNEVKIRELTTGKEVSPPKRFVGHVYCVAFHPDGKRLATVSAGAVKLWEASNDNELGLVAQVPGGAMLSAAFSPDGKELAYAGGGALVWTALDRLTGTRRDTTTTNKEGPQVDGKTIPEWVELMQSSFVKEERRIAIYKLGRFDPPAKDAIPALLEAMREDDDEDGISRWVPLALGSMGSTALPAVEGILKDKSASMRQKAVGTLAEMVKNDTKRPLELLIEVLKHDEDPRVRAIATNPFSLMLQQKKIDLVKPALPAVREALKVKDDDLVSRCVYILNNLGKEAKSAVPELLAVIKDKNREEFMRSECVAALAYIGADGKDVVDALIAALKDPSDEVRRRAGQALMKIDPEAAKKAGVKSLEPKKEN